MAPDMACAQRPRGPGHLLPRWRFTALRPRGAAAASGSQICCAPPGHAHTSCRPPPLRCAPFTWGHTSGACLSARKAPCLESPTALDVSGPCVQPLLRRVAVWSRRIQLTYHTAAHPLLPSPHSVTPSLAATGQTPPTWHRGFAAGAKAAVSKPPRVTAAAAAEAAEAAETVRLSLPTASTDSLAQLSAPDVGKFFRLSQQVCASAQPCIVAWLSLLTWFLARTGRRPPLAGGLSRPSRRV
jgi:hypothetical protein